MVAPELSKDSAIGEKKSVFIKAGKLMEPVPLKSRVKSSWMDFAEDTGFNGIPLAVKAQNRIEVGIWVVVVAVFLALTLRDICITVQNYLDQDTSTQVSATHANKDGYDLYPTFCVKFEPKQLAPKSLYAHADKVDELFRDFARKHPNVFGFLNATAHLLDDVDVASPAEPKSELGRVVGLTAQMLTNIGFLENGVAPPDTLNMGHQHFGVIDKLKDNVEFIDGDDKPGVSAASMQKVHDFYVSQNVSLPELTKVIGALMCKTLNAKIVCQQWTDNATVATAKKSVCEPRRVTWLGVRPFQVKGHVLCLNASDASDQIWSFKNTQDTCHIYVKYSQLFPDAKERQAMAFLDLGNGRVNGRIISRTTANSVRSINNVDSYFLTLLGHYIGKSTKNRRCQDKIPLLDCQGRCRAQWTLENCGCWPISWADIAGKPDDAPFCSVPTSDYAANATLPFGVPHFDRESCLPMRMVFDPDQDCKDQCQVPCDEYIYSAQLQKNDNRVPKENDPMPGASSQNIQNETMEKLQADMINATGFQLKFDNFIYPELKEELSMEAYAFFANLGGNINLWVGACIVSVVHLAMLLVKMCASSVSYVREKRALSRLRQAEHAARDPRMKPTVLLHHMMGFYKEQATVDLLERMKTKTEALANAGFITARPPAAKSAATGDKKPLSKSASLAKNGSAVGFLGLLTEGTYMKDSAEPADPLAEVESSAAKGPADESEDELDQQELDELEKKLEILEQMYRKQEEAFAARTRVQNGVAVTRL